MFGFAKLASYINSICEDKLQNPMIDDSTVLFSPFKLCLIEGHLLFLLPCHDSVHRSQ